MDAIFKGVIGQDIEVYVDDMVAKSEGGRSHCEVQERVFKILRSHQLRLNLEKCSFGVQAGRFLGYMLTERGIEANPDKCRAVINMRSPQNVKEVQQLMGKIVALSRFISRTSDVAAPVLGTLKKGRNFAWSSECEEAFLRLKAMLATPPILIRPDIGRPLHLYLSVTEAAVSSVLIQETEKEQRPVYFISKTLQGPEKRYQKIERGALALVIASRRLWPYFQSFSIVVRTDMPIQQVLRKPDLAGRMVAWSVQLSEFDISFERRGPIKAQALADFMTELLTEQQQPAEELTAAQREMDEEWYLSVDGSSNQAGSGARVILEGPNGVLVEQSLHFDFKASNNQAEYEALLAGMKLALEIEAKKLIAKSDSKLITGEREKAMTALFESFKLLHNERADLLAKLASTRRVLQRSVIHENIDTPTIEKPKVYCSEERITWTDPIVGYLKEGRLPNDQVEANKIRKEAPRYTLVNGRLYRRGFSSPLLRCIDHEEAKYVIKEVHEGSTSREDRADCMDYVKKCDTCQRFANTHLAPAERMHAIASPWPFNKWGIDILGPFPLAPGQVKFLMVAIDYFTKWVEAEPMAAITAERVKRFVWKRIVCRFGLPAEIVSDNGTQFASSAMTKFCQELHIRQSFTSVEHPQANGQAEAANKRFAKKAGRSEGKMSGGATTSLVVIPHNPALHNRGDAVPLNIWVRGVEIGEPSPRTALFDLTANEDELRANLDLLQETREIAHIKEYAVKAKVARRYNKRIIPREFQEEDLVLRKITIAAEKNKLTPKWEGPFRVAEKVGRGAYRLEHLEGRGVPRTWNASNLRREKCHDGKTGLKVNKATNPKRAVQEADPGSIVCGWIKLQTLNGRSRRPTRGQSSVNG
ncbi:Retrovirus-related Pol polyprotein from transposon 17.6, partial [Mucuna pruriens]